MTRRRRRTGPPSARSDDGAAAIGERWNDVRRRLDAISLESASGRAGRDIDDRINALVGESFALERRLVRTPAVGLTGIAAKIRIATMLLRDFSARDSIENRLLASALRDLERLGKPEPPDR
jgi:hypothetical protein